jgi:hypothetical protein
MMIAAEGLRMSAAVREGNVPYPVALPVLSPLKLRRIGNDGDASKRITYRTVMAGAAATQARLTDFG